MGASVCGIEPMDFLQIPVTKREKVGSGHSVRLRQQGAVPAVLYGLNKETLPLTVTSDDLSRFLRSGNRLVELKLGETARTAILREVQYNPLTDAVIHVDFVRVDKDKPIEDRIPLVYKGRAKGASEGGIFQAVRDSLMVSARPGDLPREIVVEIDHLGVHQGIHASEVKLPPGVTLKTPPNALLCTVITVKVEVAAAAPVEAATSEPEVIGKKPTAEGEAAEGAEAGKKPAAGAEKKAEKPEKKEEKKK